VEREDEGSGETDGGNVRRRGREGGEEGKERSVREVDERRVDV